MAPSAQGETGPSWLRSGGFDAALLTVIVAAHGAVAAAKLPKWIFSKYPDAARAWSQGLLKAEQGGDYSPLYLSLNRLLGPDALRWAQSALAAAAIVAVYWAGRRLYGRVAGLFAAAALGAAAPFLVYEATLEPDLLIASVQAVALALLAEHLQHATHRRVAFAALAGLALGLSAAARPAGWVLILLATGWAAVRARRDGQAPRSVRVAAPVALLAASALAALVPSAALKAAVGPELFATMSAGAVLQMGNRPEGTGLGAQPPYLLKLTERQERRYAAHELYRRFARASEGRALSPSETEAFWVRQVAAFARAHPVAFASAWARKLTFFLFGPDAHDLTEVRAADRALRPLPLLWLSQLAMLGLAGAALALARRRPWALPVLFIASPAVMAVGFYVVSRFRLAAVPAWCLFAGFFLASALEVFRARRKAVAWAVCGGAAFALPWLLPGVKDAARFMARGADSTALLPQMEAARSQGDFATASSLFAQMQAAQPYITLTHDLRGIPFEAPRLAKHSGQLALERYGADTAPDTFQLATLAVRAGDCATASPALRALAESGFRWAIYDYALDPWLLLARCALSASDVEGAWAAARASLSQRPGTLRALALAVALGEKLQRPEAASLRDELSRLHDRLSADHALAQAYLEAGAPEAALAAAEHGLSLDSGVALLLYERARALVALGRTEEGLAAYGEALRQFPHHAFLTRPFDEALDRALSANSADPRWLMLALEHHMRAGRMAEVALWLRRAQQAPELGSSSALARWTSGLARARGAEEWLSP